ncbi:cobyric acid synthase [bacterium AH-315-E10]|nr:cobyric acid synthase [bacterium AH-315-E10]
MFQGTSSNAGKSLLTAALCRVLYQDGIRVAPFKSQNMSLNSFVTSRGEEMARAQVVQAQACRLEPDIRMSPILLKSVSDVGSQVILNGRPLGNMDVMAYDDYKEIALKEVKRAYDSLSSEYDVMVIEGAGSPGEVNLKHNDIVNMRIAQYAQAPVLVVGDIDRGGVFASFVGTMEVLDQWERDLVSGFIVNKFRGDPSLLQPAFDYVRDHTGIDVIGTIDYIHKHGLPEEDSVSFKEGLYSINANVDTKDGVRIAVIDLPYISNFTDFDALILEDDVQLQIVALEDTLPDVDLVIIPGSKSTLNDMRCLSTSGMADQIRSFIAGDNKELIGICAGFQMLGKQISNPVAVEGTQSNVDGLNLLDIRTEMAEEKVLQQTSLVYGDRSVNVTAYEIHHGKTTVGSGKIIFQRDSDLLGVESDDGRIWGSYLHGLFDSDSFRHLIIDRIRERKGLLTFQGKRAVYDLDKSFDRIADVFRESVDMEKIYQLLNL